MSLLIFFLITFVQAQPALQFSASDLPQFALPYTGGQMPPALPQYPYFMGQGYMSVADQQYLMSQYQLPTGSSLTVTDPLFNPYLPYSADQMWPVQVSLPPPYREYNDFAERSSFSVVDHDLRDHSSSYSSYKSDSTKPAAPTKTFTITSPVKVITQTKVQPPIPTAKSKTAAGTCSNCGKKGEELTDSIKLQLKALQQQILIKKLVPEKALKNAMDYYMKNYSTFTKHDFMAVVDYNKPKTEARFYLINLHTGVVEPHFVSQGKKSGGTGNLENYAVNYDNVKGSLKTPCGGFKTFDVADPGHWGYRVRLWGLDTGINDRTTGNNGNIEIHGWDKYKNKEHLPIKGVSDQDKKTNDTDGCFAIDPDVANHVLDSLEGGQLFYVNRYGT